MTKITYIPGEIANAAIDEHGNRKPVTRTQHIFDDNLGKPQSEVNQDRAEDVATLDGKIALERQRAEGVESGLNNRLGTVEQLAEISIGGGDAQIATASDFDNPDATKRAKIPTVGAVLDGISEGVFNLTAKTGDSYASLQDALTAANTAIPANKKKGGMQLSFVHSVDNKYVQYRLMSDTFNTTVANWQGVTDTPAYGNKDLIASGGVYNTFFDEDTINLLNINDADINPNHRMSKDGSVYQDNTFTITGYIPVHANKTYSFCYYNAGSQSVIAVAARFITAFDSNKQVIASAGNDGGGSTFFTENNSVKYVRLSMYNSYWNSNLMVVNSATLPSELLPYTSEVPVYIKPSLIQQSLVPLQEDIDELQEEIDNISIGTSQIDDKAVTLDKVSFSESLNLIDNSLLHLGHSSATAVGSVYSYDENSSYDATSYIELEQSQNYILNSTARIILYVDDSGVVKRKVEMSKNILLQTGETGVVITLFATQAKQYQLEKGTIVTAYKPYKLVIPKEYLDVKEDFENDIAIASPLYMLSRMESENKIISQNDIFYKEILKRWIPYENYVFLTGLTFSKKLEKVASVTDPTEGSTLTVTLKDYKTLDTIKAKSVTVHVGEAGVGSGQIYTMVMGDSLVDGGCYRALHSYGLVPNNHCVGLRKSRAGNGQYDEGRGGWSLNQYSSISSSADQSYNPYWQPTGNYAFLGSTGFWKMAWKCYRGTQPSGFEPLYSCGRYDDFVSLFDENTGYFLNPQNGYIMYDNSENKYKVYSNGSWNDTTAETYTWSYSFKYLSIFNIHVPDYFVMVLGGNDFRTSILPDSAFTAWNNKVEGLISAFLDVNPNGRFVISIELVSTGIMDNLENVDTNLQHAAMWKSKKNIIDNFCNRENENIYVIDNSLMVDPENGFYESEVVLGHPLNTDITAAINAQYGNPHCYRNYNSWGIPIAAFIQYTR